MIFGGTYQALLRCKMTPSADAEPDAEGSPPGAAGISSDPPRDGDEVVPRCSTSIGHSEHELQTTSLLLNDMWALKLDAHMNWGELPSVADWEAQNGNVWEPIYHNQDGWQADNVWRVQSPSHGNGIRVTAKDPNIPAFDSHGSDSPASYRNLWPSSRSGAAVWLSADSTFMFGGLGMLHSAQLQSATASCQRALSGDTKLCAKLARHDAVVLDDLWRFHGVSSQFIEISKSLVRNIEWDLMHSTTQSIFQFLAPFGTMFEQADRVGSFGNRRERPTDASEVDAASNADAGPVWPPPRHEAVSWVDCEGGAWLWGGLGDAGGETIAAAQLWRFQLRKDPTIIGRPILDKTEVDSFSQLGPDFVSKSVWNAYSNNGICTSTPERCVPCNIAVAPLGLESCQATCDNTEGCAGFVVRDSTGSADGPCRSAPFQTLNSCQGLDLATI
jgi:hypothetical protein